MKRIILSLFILGTISMSAQEMPAPSPACTVMQRVGLTDVEIEYSRPSMKGRKIFGDLVPFGEIWRTGANASTKISFSTDVMINEQTVPAGKYSFYTIPSEGKWTMILNKNLNHWGVDGYNESEDAIRVTGVPSKASTVESMRIMVENITTNSADIVLSWESTAVSFSIKVDSDAQTEKNINTALSEGQRAYRNAASYYSDKGDHEKALKYIDATLALSSDNWYTQWVKAEILAASGDYKKAIKQGKMAIEMGDAYYAKMDRPFNYKANLTKSISEWEEVK